jgi:hypothetical protein
MNTLIELGGLAVGDLAHTLITSCANGTPGSDRRRRVFSACAKL